MSDKKTTVVEVDLFDILDLVVSCESNDVTLTTYAEWIGELDENDIESFLAEVYGDRDEEELEEMRGTLLEFLGKYFDDDEEGSE